MTKLVTAACHVITAGIANTIDNNAEFAAFVHKALTRHRHRDWGDVDDHDQAVNDHAADNNGRIIAAYRLPDPITDTTFPDGPPPDDRIWIITEHDRSVTTILWPSEY